MKGKFVFYLIVIGVLLLALVTSYYLSQESYTGKVKWLEPWEYNNEVQSYIQKMGRVNAIFFAINYLAIIYLIIFTAKYLLTELINYPVFKRSMVVLIHIIAGYLMVHVFEYTSNVEGILQGTGKVVFSSIRVMVPYTIIAILLSISMRLRNQLKRNYEGEFAYGNNQTDKNKW